MSIGKRGEMRGAQRAALGRLPLRLRGSCPADASPCAVGQSARTAAPGGRRTKRGDIPVLAGLGCFAMSGAAPWCGVRGSGRAGHGWRLGPNQYRACFTNMNSSFVAGWRHDRGRTRAHRVGVLCQTIRVAQNPPVGLATRRRDPPTASRPDSSAVTVRVRSTPAKRTEFRPTAAGGRPPVNRAGAHRIRPARPRR